MGCAGSCTQDKAGQVFQTHGLVDLFLVSTCTRKHRIQCRVEGRRSSIIQLIVLVITLEFLFQLLYLMQIRSVLDDCAVFGNVSE